MNDIAVHTKPDGTPIYTQPVETDGTPDVRDVAAEASLATIAANAGLPSAVSPNSKAASNSAVALLGTTTNYTGGIYILNTDPSTAVFIGKGAPTAAAGAGVFCLGPGQGIVWPEADASQLKIISTGTPIVSWLGISL